MEYNFEVIHREGKSNVGPDALSRVDIEDENQPTASKTIFMVITRSHFLKNNPTNIDINDDTYKPGESKSRLYFIEERSNVTFSDTEFDHIFYLLGKANTRMHKHIQYRLKKIIDVSELIYGEILNIDDNKSIVIISSFLRQRFQVEFTMKTLEAIKTFSIQNNYENLAFNIDQRDPRSYFELKMMTKRLFQASNIKITFFLNMILELTDIDDIKLVLTNFHTTRMGGQACFFRTHVQQHTKIVSLA